MSRYVTRRPVKAWDYDDDTPFLPSLDVDGPAEIDTGLVSVSGEPIFRLSPPIGFGRDEDW